MSETKKIIKILNSAVEDFSNSNYDSAAKKLDQILIYQPNNFDALHISGVIQGIKGNHAKAGEYLKKAIKIMPDNSYAHFNLAKSLSELGNELEALPHHLKAIQLAPNNEESWLNYGKSLLNLNKYTESITCFNQILLNNKNSVPALVNKAIALQKLDNNDGALELLNIALKINPTSAIIHNSIGVVLHSLRNYEDAIIYFERAIKIDENYHQAINNLGSTFNDLTKYEEAISYFERAIKLKKDYAEAWSNLGAALSEKEKYLEAIFSCKKAIEINPYYVEATSNLGSAFNEIGKHEEALFLYKKAIDLDNKYAEAHYNLANYYLSRFIFISGWAEYKWRFFTKKSQSKFLATSRPEWTGLNSNARLFIWAEQGIGDQILYSSMLPSLANYKNEIIISVDKKLIKIFRNSFPQFIFIQDDEVLEEKEYDQQIPMGNLGIFLRKSVNDFPKENIFLKSKDVNRESLYKNKLMNKKTCGVSWRSINKHLGIHKSMSLETLSPIFQNKCFNFINLQYGNVNEELNEFRNNILRFDELDLFKNIDDLILLISICDVVVTTSNTTAHVAGAMGKKTILLVPNSKGKMWYWNEMDGKCLWYPCINIIKQDAQGDWKSAIKHACKILEEEN